MHRSQNLPLRQCRLVVHTAQVGACQLRVAPMLLLQPLTQLYASPMPIAHAAQNM